MKAESTIDKVNRIIYLMAQRGHKYKPILQDRLYAKRDYIENEAKRKPSDRGGKITS